MLRRYKHLLELSSVQLDGTHTPANNGGAAVGYQGRKKAFTRTQLLLTDNRGQPLVTATPQAGNHHDLFQIEPLFAEFCALLETNHIDLDGLFLNADGAFDASSLRQACARRGIEANLARNLRKNGAADEHYVYFDEQLYRRRTMAEHAHAWLDSFRTLLVRYETTVEDWLAFHWLAFVVSFLRRISRKSTS
ncbi:transposase [Hymenobacter latericus]|uniref:transposase n=1 Tax=Hymenobacter sp. YIM 151858-1 TaxID=2987688 RepID=UPI002225CB62|nr:transposase [Hymenobacter sp. YIM 151858-1]UYZ61201.1 transposase [Hymenobacter sp. YIM 151858-1]